MKYIVEINFKNRSKKIEEIVADTMIKAHHLIYKKYKNKIAATFILS